VFAVGDSEGTLSLWHMPRNKELNSLSPNSVINGPALRRIVSTFLPRFLSSLSLSQLDVIRSTTGSMSPDVDKEKIVKLQFIEGDRFLVVSSDRRLLLLEMQFCCENRKNVDGTEKLLLYESLRNRSNSIDSFTATTQVPTADPTDTIESIADFEKWVQLDRARPGCRGLFDLCVTYVESLVEEGAQDRKIVQWRILETDDDQDTKLTKNLKKKCIVNRLEWSPAMFATTLDQLKPLRPMTAPITEVVEA
jgi:hypothetical protein